MNLQELEDLVRKGEGQHLEFKQKAAFPEKIVKEMVAFANSSGGQLFVGVNDDGTISGVRYADEEKYAIEKAIRTHIKPGLRYRYELIPINRKKSVLHYKIFENRRKPSYYLKDPKRRGQAFVRVEDKSMQASRELVEILKRSRTNKSFPIKVSEKEQSLFKYLEQHQKITKDEFAVFASISHQEASRILVDLVTSNILHIQIGERYDYYSMKETEPNK